MDKNGGRDKGRQTDKETDTEKPTSSTKIPYLVKKTFDEFLGGNDTALTFDSEGKD